MKKIPTFVLGLVTLFSPIVTAGESLTDAQKEHIDSFPLILVIKNTEEDTVVKSEGTPAGASSENTFYEVTTRLEGQVVEVLRARDARPGLIEAGMSCVRHVTYRDSFKEKPAEGSRQINPPTEKIIYVKTYEVREGNVLDILAYDGHIPPSSWEAVKEYLRQQKKAE